MCGADDIYLEKIDEILGLNEVRFCGVVDSDGNLLDGKFSRGKVPLHSSEQQRKIFRELAARVATRKGFEHAMGRIKYSASRREELVMISFPAEGHTLMVTAEPSINIDRLAYRIIRILGKDWSEAFGR